MRNPEHMSDLPIYGSLSEAWDSGRLSLWPYAPASDEAVL